VHVAVQLLSHNNKKANLRFVIQDTGIGIKPEKLNAIFENFTQASADTTRKYGGTGLGLSIAKKLLKLMSSDIAVTSTFGKGTTFSFDLSMILSDKPIVESLVVDPHHPVITRPIHVLLAEDNEINQIVAGNFLKKWGIPFTLATNGAEAADLVKANRYDVVLMDLQMPEMDGYEATKLIRTFEGSYFQNLPIVALSASAMNEEREMALSGGFTDFVTKPFQPLELKEKIITLAKGNTARVSQPTPSMKS